MAPRVLLIDDYFFDFEEGLNQRFGDGNVLYLRYPNAGEALRMVQEERIDAVLLDVRFERDENDRELDVGEDSGSRILQAIKQARPDLPVLMLTSYARTLSPEDIAALELADGRRQKPEKEHEFGGFYEAVFREVSLMVELAAVKDWDAEMGFVVGSSSRMVAICRKVIRFSELWPTTDYLLLGETGTGKEELAKAIWRHGPRADKPFVAVNAAALPETLLESELFGYEPGAFTGAQRSKPGKLETANGGVLFLDEVGEFSPPLQVKLLRFLQSRSFERLGSTRTITVDTCLIAATNRDLKTDVTAGRFREDLYYRLNSAVSLELPPLRNRKEAIPALFTHFVTKFTRERGAQFDCFLRPDVEARLMAYDYPGNIRELEAILKAAVRNATNSPLQASDIAIPEEPQRKSKTDLEGQVAEDRLRRLIEDAERVRPRFAARPGGYPLYPEDYVEGTRKSPKGKASKSLVKERDFTIDDIPDPKLVVQKLLEGHPNIDGRERAFILGKNEHSIRAMLSRLGFKPSDYRHQ